MQAAKGHGWSAPLREGTDSVGAYYLFPILRNVDHSGDEPSLYRIAAWELYPDKYVQCMYLR